MQYCNLIAIFEHQEFSAMQCKQKTGYPPLHQLTMIQANINYHSSMSDAAKAADDRHSIESYHKLMSDVYETFFVQR
jgi:hypothetical protein